MTMPGAALQEHITSLPSDVLSTPMGQMLAPMLTGDTLLLLLSLYSCQHRWLAGWKRIKDGS